MNSSNLQIIADLGTYLKELKSSKTYFRSAKDFTRNRIFSFETLFCLITNLPRKSLEVELFEALPSINKELSLKERGSKSGFSKARKKINWELFESVNRRLVTHFYDTDSTPTLRTWQGFLLRGIDGTVHNIVDTMANRIYFGMGGNDQKKVCQGRSLISYDPLNGLIDKAYLGHMNIGESTIAKRWVQERTSNELCIYDRGYTGAALQYMHDYQGVPYLIRSKLGHNNAVKAFVASGEKEVIQEWVLSAQVRKELKEAGIDTSNKTHLKVRLLRIELDNGEIEVLVTNLLDQQQYPYKVFKKLYFLRWPTETTIGFTKNTLCIELTSGFSPLTVMQDFFGTIIRANVQALLEQDAQQIVEQKTAHRKLTYQNNRSFAAGIIKGFWAALWLGKQQEQTYQEVVEIIASKVEPVRKNRTYERDIKTFRRNRGKHNPLKNYKRVA